MKTSIKYPLALAATFIWVGFVGGISFMEAWLKFQAPGVSLSIGLGIGKLVFAALNKVEWVLGILIGIDFWKKGFSLDFIRGLYLLPLLLLIIQSVWVLPQLDLRADLIIEGVNPGPSNLHFYYVGMEVVKAISLIFLGIYLIKNRHE